MTACVAISPDARMDSSGSCDNLHGCMSDDLEPAFRPSSVGLLKVDVISAYMTAAAEIAEREERASAAASTRAPDSAEVRAPRHKSDETSSRTLATQAQPEAPLTPTTTAEPAAAAAAIAPRDLETHPATEKPEELCQTPEENASDAIPAPSPSVHEEEKAEEHEEKSSSTADLSLVAHAAPAFESSLEKLVGGDSVQDASTIACDVGITAKDEVAELAEADDAGADADAVKNVKAAGGEMNDGAVPSAVMTEENIDRNDTARSDENPDLESHAYSDSTTTAAGGAAAAAAATNPEIESLGPTEESSTVAESIISVPAEDEDAAKDATKPTQSVANLAKSHPFEFTGLNHVALCCESLERSLEFYCGLLGLKTNLDRPDLPYRGAWLLLGAEGIHIMEVPNPDPVKGRPPHGGYDRHACLNVKNVDHLRMTFDQAGINYQLSMVPSIFCRDPDGNGLEFIEVNSVHVD
ncbi:glyoxylase I family protein [Marchantia polymorpha subsp. ruderalis]